MHTDCMHVPMWLPGRLVRAGLEPCYNDLNPNTVGSGTRNSQLRDVCGWVYSLVNLRNDYGSHPQSDPTVYSKFPDSFASF